MYNLSNKHLHLMGSSTLPLNRGTVNDANTAPDYDPKPLMLPRTSSRLLYQYSTVPRLGVPGDTGSHIMPSTKVVPGALATHV